MEKMFVCKICGHIEFGSAPEKCPVCGASKSNFEENKDAVTPAEKEGKEKHVPVITVTNVCGMMNDCRDIQIKIGSTTHPMQADHYIMWIDLYVNKKYIARYMMTPEFMQPAAGIHLKKATGGILTVIENCNKHGRWMAEASL